MGILEIAKLTETLSGDEQLELAAILIDRVRLNIATRRRHRWLNVMGQHLVRWQARMDTLGFQALVAKVS